MYNQKTNEIYFPHIIPGNVLDDKKHTFNNINGGIINIEKHNLIRNKFFGGNVTKLGLISEYGFYACPHYERPGVIVGFYIHDPDKITDKGKKLIEQKYPDMKVVYKQITVSAHRKMTPEEMEKKAKLIDEAIKSGATTASVTNANVEELEGLLKAQASGKSNSKVIVEGSSDKKEKTPVKIVQSGKTTKH